MHQDHREPREQQRLGQVGGGGAPALPRPQASITTTRSLIRHPQRAIRPLTRPTTRTDFADPLHHLRTRDGLHEAGLISSNAMVR